MSESEEELVNSLFEKIISEDVNKIQEAKDYLKNLFDERNQIKAEVWEKDLTINRLEIILKSKNSEIESRREGLQRQMNNQNKSNEVTELENQKKALEDWKQEYLNKEKEAPI
jgi:hypothetical protein